MQGLGDVISHNLATRINYDKDIGYALSSASQTVTVGSAVKALIITTLCFVQVFYIMSFFKTQKPVQPATKQYRKLAKQMPESKVELV